MGSSASSLLDGFPISWSNVEKFGSGIREKFPSTNNVRRFGSGIIDKFPSTNNVRRFGSGIGNFASKAASATSSALGSQTAQTVIKTTGTVAAAALTNGRSLQNRNRRRPTSSLFTVKIGGSKKIQDEKKPSKKEKKPSENKKKPSEKKTKSKK